MPEERKEDGMQDLLEFLERLLYTAFLQKKGTDYENISMRGLIITEKEIDQAFGLPRRFPSLEEKERKALLALGDKIAEEGTGAALPFFDLCRTFHLTPLERLALLLGAAPVYDRKFEKIYGYLQDQVDLLFPTKGLCLSLAELLGEVPEEEQEEFLSGRGNLKLLIETKGEVQKGLGDAYGLRPRIRGYLMGSMEPEERFRGRLEIFSGEELAPLEIRREYLERLKRVWESMESEQAPGMVALCGREGIGKRFLLKHLAEEEGFRLLFFDVSGWLYEKDEVLWEILDAMFVEVFLWKAYICLVGTDLEREPEEGPNRRRDKRREILSYLEERGALFFLVSEEKEEQAGDFCGRKVFLELPALSAEEKIALWRAYGAQYALAPDVDPEQNGNKYILTPRGIREAYAAARLLADMEGKTAVGQEEIQKAVKQNQKEQLGAYASLRGGRFVWEDLILGEEQKKQMRMVCDQMKYRNIVGERWGFHKKTPYGRGLSVLFYGPPGTGKTMAAQVMANELGLDLYRIDISQMISKYIGETQKNISQLFRKAKDINAVLFFDEADSLFAKRSEAKDSHDRNANAETAHLLQKLEDYEGITILATNYLNNIDDAFKRRIKFIIHIAFPEPEVRLKLWESTLPKEALCEEELDLEFFAERFELSGSSIKEILTNAAYLAASAHRGLTNQDLVEAVRLNYAKYGKILAKSDFEYLG